ncbi:MAG TPA: DUF1289 domain-containing protein [Paracoccaceae bacterium]|nr:DUF1289 domain-containing protein [Paracoccaceae bacterium]
MSDEVWRRQEIESPCVRICLVHPQAGICIGCHRTLEEIARWSAMTPEARRAVMAELPGRRGLLREAANRPSAQRRRRREGREGG